MAARTTTHNQNTEVRRQRKAGAQGIARRRARLARLRFLDAFDAYRSEHQDDELDNWETNSISAYERLCREVNLDW